MKLFMGSSVTREILTRALELLYQYLGDFKMVINHLQALHKFLSDNAVQIYGESCMTTNHHWSVHTPDQILDFGPVYDFWTFMTERLNKILKSINNNHWGGGRLEVSMMRGFGRETQFETLVSPCLLLCPNVINLGLFIGADGERVTRS
jgi:hypothetical protein